MKFAVLGAGAIGAYVGAKLVQGGSEVVMIARGEQLAALRTRGVRVIEGDATFSVAVEATDDLQAVERADVVLVTLKAYSLADVVPPLAAAMRPGTATVWAQNGIPWWYFHRHGGPLDGLALDTVDPGGLIASLISPDSAVGSVVYCAAELLEPGVVRHVEGTRFSLGEPDGTRSARCSSISEAFRAGGLRAPVVENLRAEIWLKLLGNATFNPVSALTRSTLGQLGEVPDMQAVLLGAFREIAAVATALGVTIAVSLERRLAAGIAVGDHKTSMLQDLEAGKRLEFACMTGAVVEIAQRLDIEVPRIETLNAAVALLDSLQKHKQRATESGRLTSS